MKLTPFALNKLERIVLGEDGLLPYKSGKELVSVFNSVGFRDIYNSGLPDGLSRTNYVSQRLLDINGKEGLKKLFELLFSESNYKALNTKPEEAVEVFNSIVNAEGYSLIASGNNYIINSSDLELGEAKSEFYFEHYKKILLEQLESAKYLIWAAVAWFTDPDLKEVLQRKREAGLSVQVIVLDDSINNKLDFKNAFFVYRAKKIGLYENLMHNKFCIIDLRAVVHGSYNWTIKANYNKETLVVSEGRAVAETFSDNFIKLKQELTFV